MAKSRNRVVLTSDLYGVVYLCVQVVASESLLQSVGGGRFTFI